MSKCVKVIMRKKEEMKEKTTTSCLVGQHPPASRPTGPRTTFMCVCGCHSKSRRASCCTNTHMYIHTAGLVGFSSAAPAFCVSACVCVCGSLQYRVKAAVSVPPPPPLHLSVNTQHPL